MPLSEAAKQHKREYNKRWAAENKERMRQRQAEFLERNPDYMKNAQRKHYEANREKINKRAVERRLENLDEVKKRERAYYHKRKADLGENMKRMSKDYRLRTKYKITLEQYNELFTSQGNVCASCGTDKPGSKYGAWHVDHCHITKKVRGILCHHCNVIVGMAQENTDNLKSIISYIERTTP